MGGGVSVRVIDLLPVAAIGIAVYALTRGASGNGAGGSPSPTPTPPPIPWQDPYVPPAPPWNTPLPVIPSEPDVSEGIPPPGNPFIPQCPVMVNAARYPGDPQLLCQCPTGQIQGGDPFSMNKLMLGTAPEDEAWRSRFCGL